MDISSVRQRVEKLLARATTRESNGGQLATEVFQGTITVLSVLYGDDSQQTKSLQRLADATILKYPSNSHLTEQMTRALLGTLQNLKAEIDAGFLGSLQKRLTGDVLTDFIQLARAALDESGDDAKNVAAVLTAASYEDTIRRMGASLAGVIGRDDLRNVIDALKEKGILVAPQLGIALSYLNFRNHALHANWEEIDRSSVNSVLGFVEQLIIKHFG